MNRWPHVLTGGLLGPYEVHLLAALYASEMEIRGQSAEHRCRARQERSWPIAEALRDWLRHYVDRVSDASDLGKAIRYAIRHWSSLIAFLGDGRIEMELNTVERAIRHVHDKAFICRSRAR